MRPLESLNLRECQTVRIQVLLKDPETPVEPGDEVEKIILSLVASGLMRSRPKEGHVTF